MISTTSNNDNVEHCPLRAKRSSTDSDQCATARRKRSCPAWRLTPSCFNNKEHSQLTIDCFLQVLDLYKFFREDRKRGQSICDILLRLWDPCASPSLPSISHHRECPLNIPFVLGNNYSGVDETGAFWLVVACNSSTCSSSVIDDVVSRFFESCLANIDKVNLHWKCIEDQQCLRSQLATHNCVAFVMNGSTLPRCDGRVTAGPSVSAIPFVSPPELEESFLLPHKGRVTGMLIPEGVTIITGGGFHGKSTLLRAIAYGVYDKIPGDGREFVVTCPDAVTIRAEDG